ncbi:MAG TPA: 6-carboxytetrahydropterin synthase [Terriglobia bacterium]|nr:6-carboxytetrahydropterin synthase [Terriglobia bacterium]
MTAHLTRRYRFSASHRLHNGALSADENALTYGKCNSPYGHGHNYVLEVTVAGPIDLATGMVYDLATLDETVERVILAPFDTSYLNLDVESFRRTVPTTENVCVEIFNLLRERIGGQRTACGPRLERVRLEETSSNSVEYEGA